MYAEDISRTFDPASFNKQGYTDAVSIKQFASKRDDFDKDTYVAKYLS